MKVPAIVFEGGESIRLDKTSINAGINLIKNILSALKMIETEESSLIREQWIIHRDNWVRAATPGIFIWQKKSGDVVEKGDKLGEIKDPYGTKSMDVISTYSGHIIGHNNASVVSLGDALFHIGYEYSKV